MSIVQPIILVAAVLAVWLITYYGVAAIDRRRNRKYEARLTASHRALAEAMAQREHVDELVQSITANRHKVGRE